MSRVGSRLINIPKEVKVDCKDNNINFNGPKGSLSMVISKEVNIEINDSVIQVSPADKNKPTPMWGTTNALITNNVKGVHEGFVKKIKLVGVGYRASMSGSSINFKLAYSHDINMSIPGNINVQCPDQTTIIAESANKEDLGNFCARIKSLRKTDKYRGKGIFFEGESILRKESKKKK